VSALGRKLTAAGPACARAGTPAVPAAVVGDDEVMDLRRRSTAALELIAQRLEGIEKAMVGKGKGKA